MGKWINLTAADGFELAAWRAEPEGTPKGGVVVIQEIFGVNQHIREVADGYAEQGYLAIAPAVFDRAETGVELGYDETGMQKGMALAFNQIDHAKVLEDVSAAVGAASEAGKVGVVGYCFGGLMTWLTACNLPGVAAAASYYGGGIQTVADQTPGCPVICHFGEKDAHITPEHVQAVRDAHPEVPVHVYDADHGFNCDHRASHDAAAKALAYERTLALFASELAG